MVVKNFKYNEHHIRYDLSLAVTLSENYALINYHIPDGPISRFRKLIINKDGEVVLDDMNSKITKIGKYFQIQNSKTTYFNTKTGEQGELFVKTPFNTTSNKIDFNTLIEGKTIQLFTSDFNKLLEHGEQVKKKSLLFPF